MTVRRRPAPLSKTLARQEGVPVWPLVLDKPWPKLHVLSDLHLDTGAYEIPAGLGYDILVAAGDIGPVELAVPWLAKQGKPVVYVLGNHERYGMDLDEALVLATTLAQGTQVHVLENEAVVIEGMRFLGTTLWTDFGGMHPNLVHWSCRCSNDFSQIKAARFGQGEDRAAVQALCAKAQIEVPTAGAFHPVIAALEHRKALAWLTKSLAEDFEGPTVVVSHHAPTLESLRAFGLKEYLLEASNWGHRDEDLMRVGNYASDLSEFLRRHCDDIALWVHGHLHRGIDVLDEGVRVFANPRGYALKPFTDREVAAYALMGYPVSAKEVARSQAAYAENPNRGDSSDFEASLVLDLAEGQQRPLKARLAGPLGALIDLRDDTARLMPHLSLSKDVPAECVRRALQVNFEKFGTLTEDLLSNTAGQVEPMLHRGSRHPELLPAPVPGRLSTVFRAAKKADYAQRLDWMAHWVRWFEDLPHLRAQRLREWQLLANRVVAVLAQMQLKAWVAPPEAVALRRARLFEHHSVKLFIEYQADRPRVEAELERVINRYELPREHSFVVLGIDELGERERASLLRAQQFAQRIHLPGVLAPKGPPARPFD